MFCEKNTFKGIEEIVMLKISQYNAQLTEQFINKYKKTK